MPSGVRYFGPEFFAFLRDLEANNTREWFASEKARYERDVEAPMRQFIADLAAPLRQISPRIRADPRRIGGSMFRIHRDTRFSPDKTPFKTHVAARFRHDARGVDTAPGFYVHLAPADCFGGGGIYHTDPGALRKIRTRIAEHPDQWRTVERSGLEIQGESLKRAPLGFDARDPHVEALKRKDHYVLDAYSARDAGAPDFFDRYLATCERAAPLVKFLSTALGLAW
ncbi:MAG TPA: TIGR02453 family protein [Vicinamibacterales bacterium]|nr:TIGR02453 family protein [Vicinamibacterales bacterium]